MPENHFDQPAPPGAAPQVTVTVSEPGRLDVRVGGAPYAPAGMGALTRASMGALMDHLHDRFAGPF
ncbi:MAG: hypothetical protein LBU05_00155, partial [Bifidobacteriaceae bacterium]|nr:hypothetical protein [Bifidobacteriaceae bacterium]